MIAGGQTSAHVLRRAYRRGASLHSLPGLHAKVFLFGEIAVIGSANLSRSRYFEAGIITRDHVVISGVASLIDEMSRRADVIDDRFLDRISKIPVQRKFVQRVPASFRPSMTERGNRTWIIEVNQLREHAFPEETHAATRGLRLAEKHLKNQRNTISWIRFVGNRRFRSDARKGDSVIQIYKSLDLKYPRVFHHSAILRVQNEARCTRFYVESAPDEDKRSLSWTDFMRIARASGLRRISKHAMREISEEIARRLHQLWPKAKRRLR